MPRPCRQTHADWSRHPAKRWVAAADRAAAGWVVYPPTPVGELGTLFARLRSGLGAADSLLAGFDFPIGVPEAWATAAGIRHFPAALAGFGEGRWRDFYLVATALHEVSPERPFFPAGGTTAGLTRLSLARALGLSDPGQLTRECERRVGAAPLFWTLGASQVGKAAITGWADLLQPARAAGSVRLWPFDGPLAELSGTIVVEAYPGEAYGRLGLRFPPGRKGERHGKRVQADRRLQAPRLRDWADARAVEFTPGLRRELDDGFGDAADGEDRFDALAGLLGMLEATAEHSGALEPAEPRVREVEGWIFGVRP